MTQTFVGGLSKLPFADHVRCTFTCAIRGRTHDRMYFYPETHATPHNIYFIRLRILRECSNVIYYTNVDLNDIFILKYHQYCGVLAKLLRAHIGTPVLGHLLV